MSIVKTFRFPVDVQWRGGRMVEAWASDKAPLDIATPPEFKGGVHGVWSPEELVVAAAASCYAVTLAAVAERREVPLRELDVDGVGHVARRADGRLGFTVVELEVRVVTDPGLEAAAERAARKAEELCLVAVSLDVPIHVDLEVSVAKPVLTLV